MRQTQVLRLVPLTGFVTAPQAVRAEKEPAQFLVDPSAWKSRLDQVRAIPCRAARQRRVPELRRRPGPAHPQHYAFLASETEFDQIFGRIRARHLPYWADPGKQRPGDTTPTTGRGVYWEGHSLETITRPHGS